MSDPAARRRATVLAGHRGDREAAERGLHDPDPQVRMRALGALERLGMLDDARLGEALVDASAVVRRRAVELAAGHPGVSLLAALGDPEAEVAEVAAFACGEQDTADEAVISRLGDLATNHEDPLVREAAVAALGAIGDPAGLGAILAATQDRATVRRRAVIALAPFEGPEVQAALERARTDRDWQVRQAAEDLLAD